MGWETIQLWQEILEEFASFGLIARTHGQRTATDKAPLGFVASVIDPEAKRIARRNKYGSDTGRLCQRCGKPIATRSEGSGRQRIYCGNKCSWAAYSARHPEKRTRRGRKHK